MNLFKSLKYKYARLKVRLDAKKESKIKLDNSEHMAISIFKKLITTNDTNFYISPMNGERIVENKELSMIGVLSEQRIMIINSSYQYDISINKESYDIIYSKFDRIYQRRIILTKNKWRKKVNSSLDNILSDM